MKNKILYFFVFSLTIPGTSFCRDLTSSTYDKICESQGIPLSAQSTQDICHVVVKSEVCAQVPKEDLLDCVEADSIGISDYWDFTLGCTQGAFKFISDSLSFFWEVMKWAGSNTISSDARSETADATSEFLDSSKLYLYTEYEKAYAKASPPFQDAKALQQMGNSIGKLIFNTVAAQAGSEYHELGCLNGRARNARMCQLYSEIFIPPASVLAFLKKGPKAVEEYPNLQALIKKPVALKFGALLEKFPALGKTYANIGKDIPTSKLVSDASEIPFERSNDFRPINDEAMKLRAKELAPEIQNSITAAYNALNNPKTLKTYYQVLFEEAAEWSSKKGRPEDLILLKEGKVSLQAVAVVVVKRMKQRGDNNFTSIVNGKLISGKIEINLEDPTNPNEMFRNAIKSGPFFDRAFSNDQRFGHGSFSHLIQRDIIHEAVSKETNGNPQKFYDYLGSKKGVNWWADLFDSGDLSSMTRPEVVTEYVQHNFLPTE